MTVWHPLKRALITGILIIAALIVAAPGLEYDSAAAQDPDDDPAEVLEALALRVYTLNLRTGDFTTWTGGDVGDELAYRPAWPLGTPLDGWELAGLGGDEAVTWEDLERPTLLNFWASWCPPCIQEFPDLVEIALAPDEHAFGVLFVDVWDDEESALAFIEDYPVDIHTLIDEQDAVMTLLGGTAIPTSVLLDADGTLLAVHVGTFTPAHAAFFEMVAQYPGVGSFDATNYPDLEPVAELLPIDTASVMTIQSDGQPITGEITAEDFQHVYAFEGRAGDRLTVTMEGMSGDLEPYVVVMIPDGPRLAESLDYAYEPVARVDAVTLPEDGTYLVVATRFLEQYGLSVGEYMLTVSTVP